MELLTLDSSFSPLKYIRYFDLQWNRKYYETGDFSVQILASDYLSGMAYVYSKDRTETGIIQKVEYTEDIDGNFVQLSGFFLERILADKIVYPAFSDTGNIQVLARSLVTTYKADIPKLYLGTYTNAGTNIGKQETGGELETVLHEMLQTQEMAYKCRYVLADDKIYFDVWQGLDRTQEQSTNNFVTFSSGFKNIKNVTAVTDNSNYKNFALVAGCGEGSDRITVEVDLSSGGYKRKIFVDARNEQLDANPSQTEILTYRSGLYQKGVEALADYANIENVEVETVADKGFKYLTDYDLGDKCDVVINNISKSFKARIIEINEVFSKGEHTIELTFGDEIPTIYKKARIK